MRIENLRVYGQYFEFRLAPALGGQGESGDYASVLYDNERSVVNCSCGQDGCRHAVFIHDTISQMKDETLAGYLIASRESRAQGISRETIERMRGAFAREYNIGKGVVRYPGPGLLGWQGSVGPKRMRVIQRTGATYAVYEVGSDGWDLVVGNEKPDCQSEACRRRPGLCIHAQAVINAIQEWRANGAWKASVDRADSDDRVASTIYSKTPYSMVVKVDREALSEMQSRINQTIRENMISALRAENDARRKTESLNIKKEEPSKPKTRKPTSRFKEIDL